MYIYIYIWSSVSCSRPPPTHPIWYGGLPPKPPNPQPPHVHHIHKGERYIDRCIHAYTYILYTFAHTHSIYVYTHTCKCIYEQGPPHPPQPDGSPPPVAGEGGFSQQPSRLLLEEWFLGRQCGSRQRSKDGP